MMSVFPCSHFIRLQYVRMRSNYHIYTMFYQQVRPVLLVFIHFLAVFCPPMCKHNHCICIHPCIIQLRNHSVFIAKLLHKIWIFFRRRYPVCAIRIIQQSNSYPVFLNNFNCCLFVWWINSKIRQLFLLFIKRRCNLNPVKSLIQHMIRRQRHNIKPGIYNCISHFNRCSKSGIITNQSLILNKYRLLIDRCIIRLLDSLLNVLI